MPKAKARRAGPKLSPCAACPWRTENHGKRHRFGFYTKQNLIRLWNGIRRGGDMSCHPTDPSHPEHVACGAKPGSKPKECAGSVILALREMRKIADLSPDKKAIDVEQVDQYLATRKKGLTKTGIVHWVIQRLGFGGVPYVGGSPMPVVNEDDARVSLPVFLEG